MPQTLIDVRNRWTGKSCKLNGQPAIIGGRLLAFATVRTLDGRMIGQWSWLTVERIMNNGGEFRI